MQPPDYHESIDLGGTFITIRTMRPEDREIEDAFVSGLSERSRYFRFHSTLKRLSASMLERFTNVNYPDEMALIATIDDGGGEQEIGVARYARVPGSEWAEVAIVIADQWQHKGIGSRLLISLRRIAGQAGIRRLQVTVLPDNIQMLTLARKLGFRIIPNRRDFQTIQLGKDVNGETEPADPLDH